MKCPNCQTENPEDSKYCKECASPLTLPEEFGATVTLKPSEAGLLKGTVIAGKYRIDKMIGRGGMGIVYQAQDTKLKRPVALKFLSSELMHSQEARERFVREAQAAAALDHPNICTVYEVEEHEGRVYIAMAYVDGKSLKEKIVQKPLKIDLVLEIGLQVVKGLEEAHRNGVIHRDIKPANVMFSAKGRVKIMDFGLAKLGSAEDLTKTSAVMGTVAYMSPEQALGKTVDHRTDIWSFGCLLYEMLAGHNPFQGGHEQAVFQAILHDDPSPITALRDDIPTQLERIVSKCLQKNPLDRYISAEILVQDLLKVDLQDLAPSLPMPRQDRGPSIAVLPFVDMSPEKDQDYFCEGIAEELIHALSRIQGLHVVSRTSVFIFKGTKHDVREIGQTLNVKTVLEGSVRKSGSRLRIHAQLINVEDGYQIWSGRFDREAIDIFAIQDEISLAIVDSLKITLRVGEKTALKKRSTDDPEAYNLYLKGLYFAARPDAESLNKAINFFRSALDKDPTFAKAYAGLASAFGALAVMNLAPPAEMWPKTKAALQKALSLDENLAEAHGQAAAMALWSEWDWDTAENSFERVLALNPNDAYSHGHYAWFLLSRKRFDEAILEINKAIALDPLLPLFYVWSVGLCAASGRYGDALVEYDKAMEIDPKLGLAHFHAGLAHAMKREYEAAIATLEKSKEFGAYPGWADAVLVISYLENKEKAKAARIFQAQLDEMETSAPSFVALAWQAAALGDFDRAFEFFDEAYKARDLLMPFINVYTGALVPKLVNDPRFNALLMKMNLPA